MERDARDRKGEREPSPLGVLLWPPDGFYRGIPCTCTGEEPCQGVLCNGECGCEACAAAAADNSRVVEPGGGGQSLSFPRNG